MKIPKEQRLGSRNEILEMLQSLATDFQVLSIEESLMHREWRFLNARMAEMLEPHGREGWDYMLMEWPCDVPLFNLIINAKPLQNCISPVQLHELLSSLTLPWLIRAEFFDRIVDGTMVGGNDLAEWLIDKTRFYFWQRDDSGGAS